MRWATPVLPYTVLGCQYVCLSAWLLYMYYNMYYDFHVDTMGLTLHWIIPVWTGYRESWEAV